MKSLSTGRRSLRAAVVVSIVLASAATIGASPASALPSGVYLACGYGTSVPVVGGSGDCTTLDVAITAAEASDADATIKMMPGSYCPVSIPSTAHTLTFQGVGVAGIDTSAGPVAIDGPEAALTSFDWNSAHCSGSPPANVVVNNYAGSVYFANLSVVGESSGPTVGISADDSEIGLSNVLVEDEATGLDAEDSTFLNVTYSAFLDNGEAIFSKDNFGNVEQSTMADNTGAGIDISDGNLILDHDTIAHNAVGLTATAPGGRLQIQTENSILGDNTSDCAGSDGYALEQGTDTAAIGNNLLDSHCINDGNSSDIALTSSLAPTELNGGFTPSILPPEQADGAARPLDCGADQRLYVVTNYESCDIGSINQTGSSGVIDPEADTSPLAFGTVAFDSPAHLATTIRNYGGGVGGISSVSVSGAGFSIAPGDDQCTYVLIYPQGSNYCFITVTAEPTTSGETDGTLTVDTTGGTIAIPLTATGEGGTPDASALAAPHAATVRYGDSTTLTTTLTDTASHDHVANASVTLTARSGASGTFATVATATTDSLGRAHASVHPHANTQYRWSYSGSAQNAAATSGHATVSVDQSVSAALTATKVKRGKAMAIYGIVSPNESGKTVSLERLTAGTWKRISGTAVIKHQLLPNHHTTVGYVLTYRPTRAGTESLRVARAATSVNTAGTSKRLTLKVT